MLTNYYFLYLADHADCTSEKQLLDEVSIPTHNSVPSNVVQDIHETKMNEGMNLIDEGESEMIVTSAFEGSVTTQTVTSSIDVDCKPSAPLGCQKVHETNLQKASSREIIHTQAEPVYPGSVTGMSGIVRNTPISTLFNMGFTERHKETYATAFSISTISSKCGNDDDMWFVGSIQGGSNEVSLGAFATKKEVLTVTTGVLSLVARLVNGAYWYNFPSRSFVFSGTSNVWLDWADVWDLRANISPEWHRLSWSADRSVGGYRSGSSIALHYATNWKKVVYVRLTSSAPTSEPTKAPTMAPSSEPTKAPTMAPSSEPTIYPGSVTGMSGVVSDTPISKSVEMGFTQCHIETYATVFSISTIASKCGNNDDMWFVGSIKGENNKVSLGAFATKKEALTVTNGKSEVKLINHVYWYNWPNRSFGFSGTPNVWLDDADVWDFVKGGIPPEWHRLSLNLVRQGQLKVRQQ